MKIWLDDERQAPDGWIWCKTVEEVMNQLKQNQEAKIVSLDNDLGAGHKEGFHVITQYLMCISSDTPVAKVDTWELHTMNSVARDHMVSLIKMGMRHHMLPDDTKGTIVGPNREKI